MQQYYDPDDYEQNADVDNGSKLVKDLRAQIDQAKKDLKEARDTIVRQSTQIRERTVADVLAAKGVNAKVAKLVPSDIEASEDALSKWLEEYQDLFPAPSNGAEDTQNQPDTAGGSEPPADELAARRMTTAMQGGRVAEPRIDELMSQVQSADPAQLLAMIEASKRGG